MLINSKLEKHIFALDRPHLPLQPDLEDNIVVMDPEHPTSAAAQAQAEAEAARATSAPVPRSRNEQMDLLITTVQGMQKDIKDILANQHSLVRIMENRIKTLNDKVDGLTKTVNELKKEVDSVPSPDTSDDEDDSPLRPGTHFTTQARSATVPAPDLRRSSSAPATVTSAPSAPVPPVSTPTPSTTSAKIFADAVLSTPSSTTGGDQPKNA